jgi:hypothetical protein
MRSPPRRWPGIRAACLLTVIATRAVAADEDLQQKLQNPVADLITVPFQYTGNFHVGAEDGTQHTLNIQPVYPTNLGDWNLINRLIVPLLSNPPAVRGQDRVSGLGDILYEGFLAPSAPGKLIWGIGPVVLLNTATDAQLGSGKFGAGPAIVALRQAGPWSMGALLTQVWSFAGQANRPAVSQFQLQPILSYTLDPRHTIGYSGTLTANWNASPRGDVWTVPIGLTYSTLIRRPGSMPMNIIIGGGYNVVSPSGGGDWLIRLQVNLIFSKT